jgi:hypothetical protein
MELERSLAGRPRWMRDAGVGIFLAVLLTLPIFMV